MAEPTMGEVARRLDEVARAVEKLVERLEASYVSRGVYDSDQRGTDRRITEIESDLDDSRNFRRQTILALVVMAIPVMVTLGLALFNFARGH